jgi:hypothetical protein
MKVTVSFANSFLATNLRPFPACDRLGNRRSLGHTITAGWMLLISTIFILVHDAVIAVLLGIAAAKVATSGEK